MAEQNHITIPTQYEADNFKIFLNLPNNHRILFSGKYGSGKTYFLHEFFTTHKKDEYETFHLFPTNYAIAKNEDVVKLLHFDILYELLVKGYLAPSEKMFSTEETLSGFVQNNFPKIIKDIAKYSVRAIYILESYIIPSNEKTILFESSSGRNYAGSPRPFQIQKLKFLEMQSRLKGPFSNTYSIL